MGMGISNGNGNGERSPLLGSRESGNGDEASQETLNGNRSLNRQEDQGLVGEDADKANQHVGNGRGILIILSVWGLIFLQAANMSGISTIQSKIAADLDAFATASWFTSSYLIALSSMSPLTARLAQIFSPRNCIFTASLFFSLGGVVTSQAPDLKIFLLGRVLTGIGGGGIMTISYILVLELAGKKRRGLFIGLVNTGFTMGVSLGAVVSGALLDVTGWRFLFFIQGPLGLIAGMGVFFSIPKSFTSGHKEEEGTSIRTKVTKIDYLGAITLASTIIIFLFGLSSAKIQWIPILISPFLLALFLLIEIYISSDPIIPITVLKSRGALLSCLAQLGIMTGRWMLLFYTPVYAIAVRGWSPASAGSILIPTNMGFALGGVTVGWLHIKRAGSFWGACITAYLLFALTLTLISQISIPSTSTAAYIFCAFLNGICTGSALNYTLAHLLHLTPPSTHFISTSLLATFRGFAGSFGSAIGGGLFIRVLKKGLETGFEEHGGLEVDGREDLVRRLLGGPALVKGLDGVEKSVAVNGYVGALKVLFLAGAGLAMAMVLVQAGTGWKGAGKEEEEVLIEDEIWEEGLESAV